MVPVSYILPVLSAGTYKHYIVTSLEESAVFGGVRHNYRRSDTKPSISSLDGRPSQAKTALS